MVEVVRSKDCGNSPKNQFAEQIAIAVELRDEEFLVGTLAPDCEWELENGDTISGEELNRYITDSKGSYTRLTIDHVVTHGKSGAVNGTVETRTGLPKRFCHVMTFKNTKCQEIIRLISYGGFCEA